MALPRTLDVASSVLASQLRLWRGTSAFRPVPAQPELPLRLFEFEACPYCRLVREALTELDLDVLIQPCPKGGRRFRPEAEELGGKAQFPFLVDPNTGTSLHESADIVEYLAQTYGGRAPRRSSLRAAARVASAGAASGVRLGRGMRVRPSREPAQPLELYSFESSPYSRIVREELCELELPYLLRNTAKARWEDMGPPWVRARFFPELPVSGRNRLRLLGLAGRVQVPYLVDPNTGHAGFESAQIVAYLRDTYGS